MYSDTADAGKAPRYRVRVLGCKVNQYEAQQIRQVLAWRGYVPAVGEERADVLVLHSCAVTDEAVRKSRQLLRRGREAGCLVVSGCAAAAGLLASGAEGLALVPPGVDWLERLAASIPARAGAGQDGMPRLLSSFDGHHRAFLKIQDGCDIGCSYCIVPRLRGPSRDKPLEEILAEARQLVAAGFRELVITGISIGLYGRTAGVSLDGVVQALQEVEGVARIRISSLHPGEISEELLQVWRQSAKMTPHVLLPLQSGSDRILAAMRRGYGRDDYRRALQRVQEALEHPALNTDILVGFPGETERDFQDTVDLCVEAGFARIHVFGYSPRPGTPAAGHPPLPAEVVRARCEIVRKLAAGQAGRFARRFTGTTAAALIEGIDADGRGHGYTERYLPVVVRDPAPPCHIQPVHLARWTGRRYEGVGGPRPPGA